MNSAADYEAWCASFSWDQACGELAGLPSGGINMGHEAVERHAHGERAARVAFRFLDGETASDLTYADLSRETDRFANVLGELGLGKGTRLAVLADEGPERHVAILGSLKHGTVACPLPAGCRGPELARALALLEARILVTTEALYRQTLAPFRDQLADLQYVLLAQASDGQALRGTLDMRRLMEDAPDTFDVEPTAGDDLALIHLARGAGGQPAAVLHVHGAAIAHWTSSRYALDLRDGDVFWCQAEPSSVAGIAYGLVAPLMHGVTTVVDTQEFEPGRCLRTLGAAQVSVLYTTPGHIRAFVEAGTGGAAPPALRHVASGGAQLPARDIEALRAVLGVPARDTWWQAETGAIMLANAPAFELRPGSVGRPLPGVHAFVVERDGGGGVGIIETAEAEGELALRRGWPSMFAGYLGDEVRLPPPFCGRPVPHRRAGAARRGRVLLAARQPDLAR